MGDMILKKTRIQDGFWEGILTTGDADPKLDVLHGNSLIQGVELHSDNMEKGVFAVRFPVPVQGITEGTQVFLFRNANTGRDLGHFIMVVGDVIGDDVYTELSLLRAEMETLKRAVRKMSQARE